MYRCNDCGEVFEECGSFTEDRGESIACCPNCKSDDYEEVYECKNCGEIIDSGVLCSKCEKELQDAVKEVLWEFNVTYEDVDYLLI